MRVIQFHRADHTGEPPILIGGTRQERTDYLAAWERQQHADAGATASTTLAASDHNPPLADANEPVAPVLDAKPEVDQPAAAKHRLTDQTCSAAAVEWPWWNVVSDAVCEEIDVKPRLLWSQRRARPIVLARGVIWTMIRQSPAAPSYPEIGRAFGRSHSIILGNVHAVQRALMDDDSIPTLRYAPSWRAGGRRYRDVWVAVWRRVAAEEPEAVRAYMHDVVPPWGGPPIELPRRTLATATATPKASVGMPLVLD